MQTNDETETTPEESNDTQMTELTEEEDLATVAGGFLGTNLA